MDTTKFPKENIIFLAETGSQLYGTATEDSDTDFVGVCVPPKDFCYGLYNFDQLENRTNPTNSGMMNNKEDVDETIYSITKYIRLLEKNNPNVLELLATPEDNIKYIDEFGQRLLDNKELFISKLIKNTFGGYARAQRSKIMTMNRVGSRAERYVNKFGYDVKFGMHLIRLLYFGIELLETGNIILPATNREILTDIKLGKYKLEDVLGIADDLEKRMEIAYANCSLPKKPDHKKINDFQISLLEEYWNKFPERARG
jgi:predicted nucleotidyltransferase